jgi:hypothetical protein
MRIEMPDNNDANLVEAASRLVKISSNHKITEIYGKPTKNSYMGSGRTNIFADDMTRADMAKRVTSFKELGIEYNYTINGIVPRARILENREKIVEELKWLETSPIRKITVANYELARLAEKYCPSVEVVVSFFTEVDSKEKVRQWARLSNVKTIITGTSTYRNLPLLKELVAIGKEYGVGIGLIANLGCMAECARKEEHAIIKDMASINSSALHYGACTFYCMRYLLENPEKFLQLPLIRPEDLDDYDKIGIEIIKLVDRVQTTEWIERVVGYYLQGSYDGNILDLTCNFSRFNLKKHSNAEVAGIDMAKTMQSKKGVLGYREMLPELLKVSIDHSHDLLSCSNKCDNCSGCKNPSAVKYDEARRSTVLKQLDRLEEEYLFS